MGLVDCECCDRTKGDDLPSRLVVPSILLPDAIATPPAPGGLSIPELCLADSTRFVLLPLGVHPGEIGDRLPVGLPALDPSLDMGLTGRSGNGRTFGLVPEEDDEKDEGVDE